MRFKSILRELVGFRINHEYIRNHKAELVRFCKTADVKLNPRTREDEFIDKWSRIYPKVNVDFYRFYANFIGDDVNILADDIYHTVVEPILNEQSSQFVYGNKNYYELLMNPEIFPVCVLRNIAGDYMDREYKVLCMDDIEFKKRIIDNSRLRKLGRFISKPTTDTSGGNGVHLFTLSEDGIWTSENQETLSLGLLESWYKKDFIVQECIQPSSFVRQFNETSFSTFRIFTYRSVKDDSTHFIGGYLRVGAKGSFKDNVWGGGYACPILPNGRLASFATDSQRKRYNNINGISLKKEFSIPNFDKILEMTKYVAEKNIPNRLLSFDIILDNENIPHVIEFNIKNQTVTTVQTSGNTFFGEFTDEVIEYCSKHMDKITYPINF